MGLVWETLHVFKPQAAMMRTARIFGTQGVAPRSFATRIGSHGVGCMPRTEGQKYVMPAACLPTPSAPCAWVPAHGCGTGLPNSVMHLLGTPLLGYAMGGM